MVNPFAGTPAHTEQLSRFRPSQENAQERLLGLGIQGLENNQFDFAPIEAKARNNFNTKTIPSILERLTGMNAQRSSYLPGALGAASSDLETNLAALKSQYGLQQQDQFRNLLGLGLEPSFENIYTPRIPGAWESAQGQLGQSVGQNAIPFIGQILKFLLARLGVS